MAIKSIRYLGTIIGLLKALCRYLPLASQTVRTRIPAENLEDYDAGVAAVQLFCDLLLTVDYVGDNVGTN